MDDLVTVEWLARRLDDPGLVVLDATYLPFEPDRDAAPNIARATSPARASSIWRRSPTRPTRARRWRRRSTSSPARMATLGVRRDDRIILYDDSPHRTSARAWWVMRLFGVERLAILDGGVAAWRAAGQPLERGDSRRRRLPPSAPAS